MINQKSKIKNQKFQLLYFRDAAGRQTIINVNGNSMLPLIKAGDSIFLQPVLPDAIKIGDIIVFSIISESTANAVHRIVKKKKTDGKWRFCQKGDSVINWTWIKPEDVIGRVYAIQSGNNVIDICQQKISRLNNIVGLAGWCLITVVETLHLICNKIPICPSSIVLQRIQIYLFLIFNKIIQKILEIRFC